MLTEVELAREAAETRFQKDPLEKVIHLLELLESLRSHPFLKPRIALKGGTALNLFVFDVPRLSVDIDLNYIGASDRETMLADRPKVERAIEAVCGRLGIRVRRVPSDHAGGKWRLSYTGVSGRPSTLELDVNFILRTPLWPHVTIDSRPVGSFSVTQVPVLDLHELAAGKLAALFSRNACRDLFDARELLHRGGFAAAAHQGRGSPGDHTIASGSALEGPQRPKAPGSEQRSDELRFRAPSAATWTRRSPPRSRRLE